MTDYKNCTSKNNPYNQQPKSYDFDKASQDVAILALIVLFFLKVL